ncbi:sulfite exporter TauE/SafE family protein [Halospeciosus flavus]|uniref:Probable membrane transporter protein n=1 Tax=Halospeciosus flavus TaxID=3032283 RepID=A0ABD5Z773_9EURY|nr:sulfite exporter TauE/SafE family protein [Halospeciosus flavus]
MPLGFPLPDLMTIVMLSFAICTTVCALAMEAAVIFTPAFLFVFPVLVTGWPMLHPAEAIGLSLGVEVFGYTSSVSGYWYREQVDFGIAAKLLAITIPIAIVARAVSFLVPSNVLLLAFGFMLAGLAGVLFQAHRHGGRSLTEVVPFGEYLHSPTVTKDYLPQTRLFGEEGRGFDLSNSDRGFVAVGGVMAGLVGIAIGEISQTVLSIRKRVPLKISTGTSALVLHVTIIAALLMTLALMRFAPGLAGHGFSIPLRALAVIAPTVVVGGQVGSYVNSRLSEETTLRVLMTAYFLVGTFVVVRVLFL